MSQRIRFVPWVPRPARSQGGWLMSCVLIAGKDWQARALLRAQLLEEGFEVEAFEAIPDALATLGAGGNLRQFDDR